MEFIQWAGIAALATALLTAGAFIYLYKQGRITSGIISGAAELIEKAKGVLDGLGQGDTVVGVLAEYAAKAVRVVEQMVKNGELEKDDELRKGRAKLIVEQLALADGVDAEIIYGNEPTIDVLIEAAVNEMQSTGIATQIADSTGDMPAED